MYKNVLFILFGQSFPLIVGILAQLDPTVLQFDCWLFSLIMWSFGNYVLYWIKFSYLVFDLFIIFHLVCDAILKIYLM